MNELKYELEKMLDEKTIVSRVLEEEMMKKICQCVLDNKLKKEQFIELYELWMQL